MVQFLGSVVAGCFACDPLLGARYQLRGGGMAERGFGRSGRTGHGSLWLRVVFRMHVVFKDGRAHRNACLANERLRIIGRRRNQLDSVLGFILMTEGAMPHGSLLLPHKGLLLGYQWVLLGKIGRAFPAPTCQGDGN